MCQARRAAPFAPRPRRGVTLIELMIGLAVLAIMLMSAAPSFSDWIRNTQIRSASESILNGIQTARTEAVRRNTVTRVQLTDTLGADCMASPTGRNWVVNMDSDRKTSAEGGCHQDSSITVAPFILLKSPATGSAAVSVQSSDAVHMLAYNGLGQLVAVDGVAPRPGSIDISSTQGACVQPDGTGGSVRCLRIEVSRAGMTRLCDPGLRASADNRAMACEAP